MSVKAALFATALSLAALPALAFGPQAFNAGEVTVKDVFGRLEVVVDNKASQVTASVTGPSRWTDRVQVRLEGNDLVIHQKDAPRQRRLRDTDEWIDVRVTVPAGTKLEIDGFTGEGRVGDLRGPLSVDGLTAGRLTIGHVSTAEISVAGSGDVVVGDIDRDVALEINGSGSIRTGRTAGTADMEINGSGEIDLARADGPVKAEVNGSGDINIRAGVADPLVVDIRGSGSVLLDGIARHQDIDQSGSGKVRVTGRAG
ncbi:GIN domain-containing protein [Niveispirillum fermenti]|uniref:GIN domain-containing protein n=1 Tax=Niveispirillum fermenti TaxID=1233113 RepID=UPI003A8AD6DD